MPRRLVLASASPARLRLLRAAGLEPEVVVSGVDESDPGVDEPEAIALALAVQKAEAVAERCPDALVIGCDSLLDVDGRPQGKPVDAADAVAHLRSMRGRAASLVTGHAVIDTAAGRRAVAAARTTVRFGTPSDDEIDAYVATGEALHVAGAFTLDGRSAPFMAGVDGDPGNVIGISLPLLRDLLAELDVRIVDLWH